MARSASRLAGSPPSPTRFCSTVAIQVLSSQLPDRQTSEAVAACHPKSSSRTLENADSSGKHVSTRLAEANLPAEESRSEETAKVAIMPQHRGSATENWELGTPKNEAGLRPATSVLLSGKLSWVPSEPESSTGNRASVAPARRNGRTARPPAPARGTVRGLAGMLHGGSRSDCSERGVASDPVECRATAVRRVRAHPILRSRPGLESGSSRRRSKLRFYYPAGPGAAGSMSGIASRPASLASSPLAR